MSVLTELQNLLNIGSSRVSGTIISVTDQVAVQTKRGLMYCPKPTFNVKAKDLVVIEANQVVYNLGQKSSIPVYRV